VGGWSVIYLWRNKCWGSSVKRGAECGVELEMSGNDSSSRIIGAWIHMEAECNIKSH
jgi:hypothetical protein